MQIINNSIYSAIILLFLCLSFPLNAKDNTMTKMVRISIPLSDNISNRYEKYHLFAYNYLGYQVIFDRILIGRARELVNKGELVLYCNKSVVCDKSVFNDADNVIGVTSGKSISSNFIDTVAASSYAIKSDEDLGSMLTKGRLYYVLLIDEVELGNLGSLDESLFNTAVVYHSEGFHYINKKHKNLLPGLTQGFKLAIEHYGPLVSPKK